MSSLLAAVKVNNRWPQWLIFAIYVSIIGGVAIYTRKKSKSVDDFMFANKGVGGWLSAFSYGTTYFSAVVFIGFAGKTGWEYGLSSIWIGIGNAVFGTLLAWLVLAKRTKYMTSRLKTKTMPEFFEKRYDAKYIKIFAAIIIFVFLVPYSSSVYQGMGHMFESTLGIPGWSCIIILALLTAIYLFVGGYFATTITDFIQGIIMIFGLVIVLFMLISKNPVNWGKGFSVLGEAKGIIPHANPSGKGFFQGPLFNITILTLLTSFGIWGLPQSVHKFYAIKDESEIKKGVIISTIFAAIIGVGAYFMGSLVSVYFAQGRGKTGIDQLVPKMLLDNLKSPLYGLIMVLLFSASMSTLAALSLSSSSTVTIDVINGYRKKKMSDKNTNIVLRVLCLVFVGISAVLAAFKVQAIVTLMSLGWGAIAGCFIGPYIYGLFWKRANKFGAYASLIAGILITILLTIIFGAVATKEKTFANIITEGVKRSPITGVIAMISSMIVTPLFSIMVKIQPSEEVERIFAQGKNMVFETTEEKPVEEEKTENQLPESEENETDGKEICTDN